MKETLLRRQEIEILHVYKENDGEDQENKKRLSGELGSKYECFTDFKSILDYLCDPKIDKKHIIIANRTVSK